MIRPDSPTLQAGAKGGNARAANLEPGDRRWQQHSTGRRLNVLDRLRSVCGAPRYLHSDTSGFASTATPAGMDAEKIEIADIASGKPHSSLRSFNIHRVQILVRSPDRSVECNVDGIKTSIEGDTEADRRRQKITGDLVALPRRRNRHRRLRSPSGLGIEKGHLRGPRVAFSATEVIGREGDVPA